MTSFAHSRQRPARVKKTLLVYLTILNSTAHENIGINRTNSSKLLFGRAMVHPNFLNKQEIKGCVSLWMVIGDIRAEYGKRLPPHKDTSNTSGVCDCEAVFKLIVPKRRDS